MLTPDQQAKLKALRLKTAASFQAQGRIQMLSGPVGLTDDQKAKLKPILSDAFLKMDDVRADATLDAKAKGQKLGEIQKQMDADVGAILTPDQQQKLKAYQEEGFARPGHVTEGDTGEAHAWLLVADTKTKHEWDYRHTLLNLGENYDGVGDRRDGYLIGERYVYRVEVEMGAVAACVMPWHKAIAEAWVEIDGTDVSPNVWKVERTAGAQGWQASVNFSKDPGISVGYQKPADENAPPDFEKIHTMHPKETIRIAYPQNDKVPYSTPVDGYAGVHVHGSDMGLHSMAFVYWSYYTCPPGSKDALTEKVQRGVDVGPKESVNAAFTFTDK